MIDIPLKNRPAKVGVNDYDRTAHPPCGITAIQDCCLGSEPEQLIQIPAAGGPPFGSSLTNTAQLNSTVPFSHVLPLTGGIEPDCGECGATETQRLAMHLSHCEGLVSYTQQSSHCDVGRMNP